jgi:adenylate cyclase
MPSTSHGHDDGSSEEADRQGTEDSPRRGSRARALGRWLNPRRRLFGATRRARDRLPGDSRFGDPLSTAGGGASQAFGRRLAQSPDHSGVLREVGLSALQVWQAVSERQGRGRGEEEIAIVFTDLVDFSAWALQSGDTLALELLRRVGEIAEPAVSERDGEVVKRLGDGLMAVFPDAQGAVDAVRELLGRLDEVEVHGHRPELRAGIHVGRPRRLGGDYLGVDVNIAARMLDSADAGEIVISETACRTISDPSLRFERRRWLMRPKGAPKDLKAFVVQLQ